MSLAFQIEVNRSSRSVGLLLASLGLGVGGSLLAAFRFLSQDAGLALIEHQRMLWGVLCIGMALGVLVWGRWAFHALSSQDSVWRVDEEGVLSVECADRSMRVMHPLAHWSLPGMCFILLAPRPSVDIGPTLGAAVVYRVSRSALAAHEWRKLQVWLRWTERGPLLFSSEPR